MQSMGEFRRQSPFKEVLFLGKKLCYMWRIFGKYKAFLNWERKSGIVKSPEPRIVSLADSLQESAQN